MKHTTLSHAAWGLGVLTAFALGYFMAGPREAPPAARSTLPLATIAGPDRTGPGTRTSAGTTKDVSGSAATGGDSLSGRPLSPAQIESLAKEALNSPNPLTRNLAFAKLLESMTPDNVHAVMQAMEENRADGDQWRLFQYAWGAMDGAGALKHAETLEGDRKGRFMAQAVAGWASKEPSSARAWLDALPEGDEKNRHRGNFVNGLADHDIGMATDYVFQRAGEGDKQAMQYLETVAAEELRKSGTAHATLWAERLPDGPLKGAALDRVAGAYVNENPEAAAAWAAQFASADFGSRVIEEVGDEWAERDPRAAVSWLESLPEGAGRAEGMHSALREWTQRDAVAASEYLAALPPSASRDSAVSGFARTLASQDPESAVTWASTIANEQSRVETLTQAGRAWYRRDAPAAEAWLQSANLPEAARQAVIAPRGNDRQRRG